MLRLAEPAEVPAALAEALAGGRPVAPLPTDPAERAAVLRTLAPDEPVTEPDTAVVVTTSGSTGAPKGVVLTRTALRASASATHDRLGGPGDWVLALPDHYVAGLMVLARAELAGTTVTTVGGDLAGLPAAVDGLGPRRYLSLVASQLARALDAPAMAKALARCTAVLLGGGPAEPALLDRARRAGIPVRTTYGMSETCGGCVYDGVPLDGVQLDLTPEGRIRIGGPVVFAGYHRRPDLTAEVLHDGVLVTRDRGRLDSAGRLTVLGRVDDVVISGGLNVDLAAVERLLADWPERGDALAVLGLPDDRWGIRVVAAAEGPGGDLVALRRWLAERLPAYAAPRQLLRLPQLPRTPGGKIDRQALVHRPELSVQTSLHPDTDEESP